MMDIEFDMVKDELHAFILITTAAKEHFVEIEQRIQTVKEQCHEIISCKKGSCNN